MMELEEYVKMQNVYTHERQCMDDEYDKAMTRLLDFDNTGFIHNMKVISRTTQAYRHTNKLVYDCGKSLLKDMSEHYKLFNKTW